MPFGQSSRWAGRLKASGLFYLEVLFGGSMAEITLAVLREFVIKHGNIKIVDLTGKTHMLQPDVPDAFDLVEKANRLSRARPA
jgi:hypothetical protein